MTLRITRERGSRYRANLKLEGRLVAEWAALLERECLDLLLSRGAVRLNLAGVVFVDLAGVEALGRLSHMGVEIHCRSRLVASVLEGEGIHVTVDAEEESHAHVLEASSYQRRRLGPLDHGKVAGRLHASRRRKVE